MKLVDDKTQKKQTEDLNYSTSFEQKQKLSLVVNNNDVGSVPVPLLKEAGTEPLTDLELRYGSKLYTAKEFIEDQGIELVPIVKDLIYEKTLNMVIGRPKGGKSTFTRYLLKCIADGDGFLGYKTYPCKVLYLPLDEPSSLIKIGLSKVNIQNPNNILITKLENSENDLEAITSICLENGVKVVIVDLISKIMDVEDSSKYSEVSKCLRKFRDISDNHNISFIFLHHSTKNNSKSVLGSQSIAGAMDNILYITDSKGKYFYETEGRYEAISKTEIILDKDNNHLSINELSELSDEEAILFVIGKHTKLSKNSITSLIKKKKSTVLKLVDKLVNEQKLVLTSDKEYAINHK